MTRPIALAAAALLSASPARAQVDIRVQTLTPAITLFLPNEGSGTSLAFHGPDGVLIVDTMADSIAAQYARALEAARLGTVRHVVNTHWHHNHLGANRSLGPDATVIGTPAMQRRMAAPQTLTFLVRQTYPARDRGDWPTRQFTDTLTLRFNGEPVRLRHVRGHTDTDVIALFPRQRVAAVGDLWGRNGWIPADLDTGGDMRGVLEALTWVTTELPADGIVVGGHGAPGSATDLRIFVERLRAVITQVDAARAAGRTMAEAQAGPWSPELQSFLGRRGPMLVEAIWRSPAR